MSNSKITVDKKDLALIVSGLVKEGIVFTAEPSGDNQYAIYLTGGF